MRTLNYYEVGVDPLPIVGLDIGYYETNTSFGMFQSLDACSGTIELYGEENFVDDEISIDEEGFDDLGEPTAKTLYVGEHEFQLKRGVIWCYIHDYYAVTDPSMFPFQCDKQLAIAIEHGIVKKVSEHIEERTGKQVDVELKFKTKVVTVHYMGKTLDIKFFNYKDSEDGWYFHGYKDHNVEGWGF